MRAMRKTTPVIENYLRTIYSLLFHSSLEVVKPADLKEKFGASPSTIHATLCRMKRDGWIVVDFKDGIKLTGPGMEKAKILTRRHRLIEVFLYKSLDIPWNEVHTHAAAWGYGISPLVEERLANFLGFPKSCPHGIPIPGISEYPPQDMFYLDKAVDGSDLRIIMIGEQLEDSEEIMTYLLENQIFPGVCHHILQIIPRGGSMYFRTDISEFKLNKSIAGQIGVCRVG
jgi:DtxR family Mn-dependent transcriptional regulator